MPAAQNVIDGATRIRGDLTVDNSLHLRKKLGDVGQLDAANT